LVDEGVFTVTTFLGVEKDSKDGTEFHIRGQVNNVHLEVHVPAIDGVLRGRVEMELKWNPLRHFVHTSQIHSAVAERATHTKVNFDTAAGLAHCHAFVVFILVVKLNGQNLATSFNSVCEVDG